jgi:hypothetical protein
VTDFEPSAFRAQVDQAQAAFKDLAPAIAEFWKALIASGMTENAATLVVCQWVVSALSKGTQG